MQTFAPVVNRSLSIIRSCRELSFGKTVFDYDSDMGSQTVRVGVVLIEKVHENLTEMMVLYKNDSQELRFYAYKEIDSGWQTVDSSDLKHISYIDLQDGKSRDANEVLDALWGRAFRIKIDEAFEVEVLTDTESKSKT